MIDPEPSYVEDSFEFIFTNRFYFSTWHPQDRTPGTTTSYRGLILTGIQMPPINFETKKALHENKDDDGFGPTIKKAAKNPDGTEKDKWRTTGGATFEDNIQV